MSETSPPSAAPAPNVSVEALKRLKSVETDSDDRLKAAIARGEDRLKRLRAEAEVTVRSARDAAEKAADAAVEKGREDLGQEVDRILASGQAEAAKVGQRSRADIDGRRDKLFQAIFGEFDE
jgi:vacuolar-type H+-ATPase subunit H